MPFLGLIIFVNFYTRNFSLSNLVFEVALADQVVLSGPLGDKVLTRRVTYTMTSSARAYNGAILEY